VRRSAVSSMASPARPAWDYDFVAVVCIASPAIQSKVTQSYAISYANSMVATGRVLLQASVQLLLAGCKLVFWRLLFARLAWWCLFFVCAPLLTPPPHHRRPVISQPTNRWVVVVHSSLHHPTSWPCGWERLASQPLARPGWSHLGQGGLISARQESSGGRKLTTTGARSIAVYPCCLHCVLSVAFRAVPAFELAILRAIFHSKGPKA
jgi:hypothetical protein